MIGFFTTVNHKLLRRQPTYPEKMKWNETNKMDRNQQSHTYCEVPLYHLTSSSCLCKVKNPLAPRVMINRNNKLKLVLPLVQLYFHSTVHLIAVLCWLISVDLKENACLLKKLKNIFAQLPFLSQCSGRSHQIKWKFFSHPYFFACIKFAMTESMKQKVP